MTKLTTVRKSTQTIAHGAPRAAEHHAALPLAAADAQSRDAAEFRADAGGERHGFNWGEDSILPYQVSDDYDREQRPAELDVLVIENERLRAVIAPSLGGRLLELKDLASGRDLVFRNPVFQPANLAALNAWFSGGIEWNGLIPGHTPFTCAPVFAGVRETEQGPILRIYEFDRIVEATWQIDLFLPAGSAQLFAHGRIVNPSAEPRLAYWWTNIAAPMSEGTRVLSPAEYSIEHIWPGNNLGRCDFPQRGLGRVLSGQLGERDLGVLPRAIGAAALHRLGRSRGLWPRADEHARDGGPKVLLLRQRSRAVRTGWTISRVRARESISRSRAASRRRRTSGLCLRRARSCDWTEAFAPVQLDAAKAHDPDYRSAVSHAAAVAGWGGSCRRAGAGRCVPPRAVAPAARCPLLGGTAVGRAAGAAAGPATRGGSRFRRRCSGRLLGRPRARSGDLRGRISATFPTASPSRTPGWTASLRAPKRRGRRGSTRSSSPPPLLDRGDADAAREHAGPLAVAAAKLGRLTACSALATRRLRRRVGRLPARVGDGRRAAGTRRRDRHAPHGRRTLRRAQGVRRCPAAGRPRQRAHHPRAGRGGGERRTVRRARAAAVQPPVRHDPRGRDACSPTSGSGCGGDGWKPRWAARRRRRS